MKSTDRIPSLPDAPLANPGFLKLVAVPFRSPVKVLRRELPDDPALVAMLPVMQMKAEELGRRGIQTLADMGGLDALIPSLAIKAMPPGTIGDSDSEYCESAELRNDGGGSYRVVLDMAANFEFELARQKITANSTGQYNLGVGAHEYWHLLVAVVGGNSDKLPEPFRATYKRVTDSIGELFRETSERLDLSGDHDGFNEVVAAFFSTRSMCEYLSKHPRLTGTETNSSYHRLLCDGILLDQVRFPEAVKLINQTSDEDLVERVCGCIFRQQASRQLPSKAVRKIPRISEFPDSLFDAAKAGSRRNQPLRLNMFVQAYADALPESEKKEGCFIATAVYGDENAEDVVYLREFRDRRLLSKPLGERAVALYYRQSPTLVVFIRDRNLLKWCIRAFFLEPLVRVLRRLKC